MEREHSGGRRIEMKTNLSALHRAAIASGIGVALAAGIGVTAASADRIDDLRNDVRHDVDIVSRDRQRIRDMQAKRRIQQDKGDYRHARMTADDIANARIDLKHDEDKLRIDQRELERIDHRGHHRW